MKSRTSFFNKTVFEKNLTRFAPAWGLYSLCLMMGLFMMLDSGYWLPSDMGDCVQIMSIITPCYALLVAQLLFGDLFNARMCNALHALPPRRETWFVTNVVSGIVFHLIPTAIMGTVATVIMALECFDDSWIMGLYWFLGINLQYLCFFGIAVLSVFCVGSRFAQAVVYGILNFLSLILAWLVDALYMPMFYGMKLNIEPLQWFCPVWRMMEEPFVYAERTYNEVWSTTKPGDILLGGNFWYYFICAGVGILLMVTALQMYRKRKLECAGDFIAIKWLEPVFQVGYSLMVGAGFHFVIEDIFGYSNGLLFLFVGLGVGYFTGRMLLMRNVRVFQKKGWLGCAGLMVGFGLTLLIAALDPFGIESWVPKAERVASVTIVDGHYNYYQSKITLEDAEDIETVITLHEKALTLHEGSTDIGAVEMVEATAELADNTAAYTSNMPITFTYRMKDGRTISRYYYFWSNSSDGQIIKEYFSSVECLFGLETDADGLAQLYPLASMDPYDGDSMTFADKEDIRGLLEAILADCEAGNMAQTYDFHGWDTTICWLTFSGMEKQIRIFPDCENTVRWLEEHDVDIEHILEVLEQYY